MKQSTIYCPKCGKKLQIKSINELNFKVQLSQAENQIWCKMCKCWIKFNINKKGENDES